MGFFSKMKSIQGWTESDLKDEHGKLGQLMVDNRGATPWSNPELLDAHTAKYDEFAARQKAIDDEIERRGTTLSAIRSREMMQLFKPK